MQLQMVTSLRHLSCHLRIRNRLAGTTSLRALAQRMGSHALQGRADGTGTQYSLRQPVTASIRSLSARAVAGSQQEVKLRCLPLCLGQQLMHGLLSLHS